MSTNLAQISFEVSSTRVKDEQGLPWNIHMQSKNSPRTLLSRGFISTSMYVGFLVNCEGNIGKTHRNVDFWVPRVACYPCFFVALAVKPPVAHKQVAGQIFLIVPVFAVA